MGFPSPAQDYVEERISLDKRIIARPAATYFMRSVATITERTPFTELLAGWLTQVGFHVHHQMMTRSGELDDCPMM